MLISIIENRDKTYEYLYQINNNFIGYHISPKGIKNSNETYLNNLLVKFKYNENCEYLTKFKEFEVYYDKQTSLKHFISNGKEDFTMLFKFNGENSILYNNKNGNLSNIKKFIICGICVIVSFSSFMMLSNNDFNIKIDQYTNYFSEELDIIKEPINYKDAIDSINSSNIYEDVKEIIMDESFLNLVFSYYENTSEKYIAFQRFNNLELKTFQSQDDSLYGYYDRFRTPNVIYVKEGIDNRVPTTVHEFIHLLERYDFIYISEASAELIASELLGGEPMTYLSAVDNLKLLINIVGPEPIYKLIFGGDDTELVNILKNNLSKEEYIKLKFYLKCSFMYDEQLNIDIQNLLLKLYNNLYKENIDENPDIIYKLSNVGLIKDERKFFLTQKMNNIETITIENPNMELLEQYGYVTKKVRYRKLIKINTPISDLDLEDIVFKEKFNNETFVNGKVISNGEEIYYKHLDFPLYIGFPDMDEGFIDYIVEQESGKKYSIEDAINKGFVEAYKFIYSNERKQDFQEKQVYYTGANENISIDKTGNIVTFKLNGIKTRFPNQYDNLTNIPNSDNYHK